MNKQNEERKTVFRRIGGRIVPISVGIGAVYGSSKISVKKTEERIMRSGFYSSNPHENSEKMAKSIKERARKVEILKRFYKKDISRELGEEVEIAGRLGKSRPVKFNPFEQSGFSHHTSGNYGTSIGENKSQSYKMNWADNRPSINVANGRESTFLHELGHAQQYREKTKLQNLDVKLRLGDGTNKNKLFIATHKAFKKVLGKNYYKISSPFGEKTRASNILGKIVRRSETIARDIDLDIRGYKQDTVRAAFETEAWVKAVKMARPKAKMKVAIEAIKPLSTYFIRPTIKTGKALLAISGISAIAYGLFKENK